MWIEYVRDGLQKGQQVFRRSVIEALLQEVEQQKSSAGDTAEVAALKRELAIVKKQYRDLNIRYHQRADHADGQGAAGKPEFEGDSAMTARKSFGMHEK